MRRPTGNVQALPEKLTIRLKGTPLFASLAPPSGRMTDWAPFSAWSNAQFAVAPAPCSMARNGKQLWRPWAILGPDQVELRKNDAVSNTAVEGMRIVRKPSQAALRLQSRRVQAGADASSGMGQDGTVRRGQMFGPPTEKRGHRPEKAWWSEDNCSATGAIWAPAAEQLNRSE